MKSIAIILEKKVYIAISPNEKKKKKKVLFLENNEGFY
jgi:hypothetical protein